MPADTATRSPALVAAVVAVAAALVLLLCSRRPRPSEVEALGPPAEANGGGTRSDGPTADDLLQEVARRSPAVLMVVSNSANKQFSLANLTKYLRMKGVDTFEGSTPEETILVNARRLLEFMDSTSSGPGGRPRPAPGNPLRHELIEGGIPADELVAKFPAMKEAYVQQPLDYGRNSRYGDKWRISCYLVVMDNWKPKIEPHLPMVDCMGPVMDACTQRFARWYCSVKSLASIDVEVMNAFVTRYRPVDEEDQLKKHIDGANVDGSVILALPTDEPWEGGELLVWDGKPTKEFTYRMKSGDLLFLDNAVWHQAKPITTGTRWALVLFLRLLNPAVHGSSRIGAQLHAPRAVPRAAPA